LQLYHIDNVKKKLNKKEIIKWFQKNYLQTLYKEWSPIIDTLYIDNIKLKKYLIEYAVRKNNQKTSSKPHETNIDLLTISLKILSKLNLDNVELDFCDDCKSYNYKIILKHSDYPFIHVDVDTIAMIENVFINDFTIKLNNELKNAKKFILCSMIDNIFIEKIDNFPTIIFESKYIIK